MKPSKETIKILISQKDEIMKERILPNITIQEKTLCWVWKREMPRGYIQIGIYNNKWFVHRLVCTLYNGEIPDGLLVRHLCDNKACCNPDHLKIGTKSENAFDIYKPGKVRTTSKVRRKPRPKNLNENTLIEWVKNNLVIISNHECWDTDYVYRPNSQYSTIRWNSKSTILHRLLFCIQNNKDYYDSSFVARHICNNKRCVNPNHIISGSISDNAIDSRPYSKCTILTKDQVIAICKDYNNIDASSYNRGIKGFAEDVSKNLGCTKDAILGIIYKKSWTDVSDTILIDKTKHWRSDKSRAKLNPKIVCDIRNDMPNWDFTIIRNKSVFDLHWASKTGVSINSIQAIRTNYTWKE